MKRILLFASMIGLTFCGQVSAQKTKPTTEASDPTAKAFAHHRAIFEQALAFNDLSIATQATYEILALGESYSSYLDTLTILYFQRAAWPQVISVSSKILEKRPNDPAPRELRAVAYQTAGLPKESLTDYETLYGITKNPYHLYEIAALQYTLRRFGECDASLGKLLKDPAITDLKIQINSGQNTQEVPMIAACTNMVGVLLMDQGKKTEAKVAFQDALKAFPDFILAKNNLAEAEKP